MRRAATIVSLFFLAVSSLFAQTTGYGNRPGSHALIAPPYGTVAHADPTSSIFVNPAGIGWDGSDGILFTLPGTTTSGNPLSNQMGFAFNMNKLGFAWETYGPNKGSRYTLGSAATIFPGFTLGSAFHWSSDLDRSESADIGVLMRPTRWLSTGLTISNTFGSRIGNLKYDPSYTLGLALRPLGPRLTLTAEATLWQNDVNDYGQAIDPTFTVSWATPLGLSLRGGYAFENEIAFAGAGYTFGVMEAFGWGGSPAKTPTGGLNNSYSTTLRLSSKWTPTIADRLAPPRVVVMTLRGTIVEEQAPPSFFRQPRRTLLATVSRIDKLSRDDRVEALCIKLDDFAAQFTDISELRDALLRFRNSGKKVMIYSTQYSMGSLYLASGADQVWIYPTGRIMIPGFGGRAPFLRGLLEKLHAEPQFLTVGKYKSAAETFTRNEMSEPAKEALDAYLETLWLDWISAVADGRGKSADEVIAWVDDAIHTAQSAQETGMVDKLLFPDQIRNEIKQYLERSSLFVLTEQVHFSTPLADLDWPDMSSPEIAVVYAVGEIREGRSRSSGLTGNVMGSETVASAIRAARKDKRVKAIVLRVDSPGGDALASDIIAREIRLATDRSIEGERHIPVIVSMSGVAASGGYYISCLADTILAPAGSLTGSIGVLSGKIAFEATLDSLLGITFDGVERGRNAGMMGINPWNDEQLEIIQKNIDQVYNDFAEHVAEGRGLEREEVDKVAQGRIWSGSDAIENRLVDIEGGLYDAIQVAKERAGIPRAKMVELRILPRIGFSLAPGFASILVGDEISELRKWAAWQKELERLSEPEVRMLLPLHEESLLLK